MSNYEDRKFKELTNAERSGCAVILFTLLTLVYGIIGAFAFIFWILKG